MKIVRPRSFWAATMELLTILLPLILTGFCGIALAFAPTTVRADFNYNIDENPPVITFQPPSALGFLTLPPGLVTTNGATLVGTGSLALVPYGSFPTIAYFQYGLTTNYTESTPSVTLVQEGQPFSISVPSLAPATTYYFRAVISCNGQLEYGNNLSFTTPAIRNASAVVSNLGDSGSGSLRDAIASLLPGGSITFAANLSGQTITLTSGAIVLSNSVTIDASALANGIQINGNANSEIFQVYGDVSVSLDALTITNGYGGPSGFGGAILNDGTLVLSNCTVAGNSVGTNGDGGAIANEGSLFLNGCTLFNNSGAFAGAIENGGAACELQNCTLYGNSAIAGNGGAIDNIDGATLSMLQCTVSGNSAAFSGGGIDNYKSQLSVINTIISGNVSLEGGGDIYNWSGSTNTATGANIVQDLVNDGTTNGTGSILDVDPLLGPLANNGGPTLTMLPQAGSPAIDEGLTSDDGGLSTDQRGLPRVSGYSVDIGAVEVQLLVATTHSVVTTNYAQIGGIYYSNTVPTTGYLQWGLTTNYGNTTAPINLASGTSPAYFTTPIYPLAPGTTYHFRAVISNSAGVAYGADLSLTTIGILVVSNTNDSGPGSLREAVSNSLPDSWIYFASGLSGRTITLTSGAIELSNSVIISASALANGVAIDGNATTPIFQVDPKTVVTLVSLTITNGYNSGNYNYGLGGGIAANGADLVLNNCKLVNNRSAVTGGALSATFGSLNMDATTISGNTCDYVSAIYIQDNPAFIGDCTFNGNYGGAGDALRFNAANYDCALSIYNSTFTGNVVSTNCGSAITIEATGDDLSAYAGLTNCTIVSNTVIETGQPAAVYLQPGDGTTTTSLGLYNTIISGNTSGGTPADITGSVLTTSSFDLIGSGGGLVNGVNGNQIGINNPLVAALGNYGGPTQTMPPLHGSPAIDGGGPVFFSTDQRGLPRLSGNAVDIGAVEVQIAGAPPALTGVSLSGASDSESGNEELQFSFTNLIGGSFTVFATTNLALPLDTWLNLGAVPETPIGSGQFQFIDTQVTNYPQRFYRVTSP